MFSYKYSTFGDSRLKAYLLYVIYNLEHNVLSFSKQDLKKIYQNKRTSYEQRSA